MEVGKDRGRAQTVSARSFSACKADSSLSWREEGDTSCHQESAFSFKTLQV
jgi:hypothetical protein